jgi:cysteine desulfurase
LKNLVSRARARLKCTVVYFDHNATGPLLPEARQAWLEAADSFVGNPSSPHRLGSRADHALNDARERMAAALGCHATQLIFTSGATESGNTFLQHAARTLPSDAEVWISAIEHPCVLEPARFYFGERLRQIPVDANGVANCEWLEQQIQHKSPGLVALMAANNETGALQPWQKVLSLCRGRKVPFFCDAVQWIGRLPAPGLGECDWVSGSAHKFGGPRGVGFLKVPDALSISPLIRGGPQEDSRRAGTENVAGVLAMAAALEVREKQIARDGIAERMRWRENFESQLMSALPGAEIMAHAAPRLWNTVAAFMPETGRPERWVVKLDKLGFAVSTGSACSSGKEEPSHVLQAMNCSPARAARALRFSAGWETTPDDWAALLAALQDILGQGSPGGQKILAKPAVME